MTVSWAEWSLSAGYRRRWSPRRDGGTPPRHAPRGMARDSGRQSSSTATRAGTSALEPVPRKTLSPRSTAITNFPNSARQQQAFERQRAVPACRPPLRGENRCAGTNRRAPRPVPRRRRGEVCAGRDGEWDRCRDLPRPRGDSQDSLRADSGTLPFVPWVATAQTLAPRMPSAAAPVRSHARIRPDRAAVSTPAA